jgi:hypothetical protein
LLLLDVSSGSAAADPAVRAYVLGAGRPRGRAPEQRVRLCQAAAEPVQERDWRGGGGGVAGCVGGVSGGGGVHEAVVVGGSVEVGDVLLGDDEGELGMHGCLVLGCGAGTVIRAGCSGLAVR